ncbi:fibrinogen-like YCDxxxxGGGW domain-containing protein [Nannocystaceae bacterium ST9]
MYDSWKMGSRAALGLFCLVSAACSDDGSTDDEVGETSTDTQGDTGSETATETGSSSADTSESDTTQGDTTTDTTGSDTSESDTTGSDTATTSDTTGTDTTTGEPDVCGDAMITGDEICDDGVNDGSYAGCNPDCLGLAAYCGDMQVNGPEECDDALNGDAADGCLDSCVVPNSCLELHEYDAMLGDGVYLIDPEGFDGDPFAATCDMTTDGGGWTLAMRFAPAMAQFHFYSTHWTTNSVVNELVTDPVDPSDGKFMAYNELPGDAIRGCLRNPQDMSWGCKPYDLPMTTTLLDLFTTVQVGSDVTMKGLYFMETQAEKVEWLTIQGRTLAQSSVPNPNYVQVGINIDDDQSCYDARVRFGLVLNNENSVVTLNDAAGFGAQSYFTAACDLGPGVDSGWKTASGFAAGQTLYNTAGQIWVR